MSRQLGIDIRPGLVRIALLRSSYRAVTLVALNEVRREQFPSLKEAVKAAAEPYLHSHEGIAVALHGGSSFIHRLTIPPAALKHLDEVIPFELEAQVPVEFEELVYDSRVLPRDKGAASVSVLAAAAPQLDVQRVIDITSEALAHDAERVGVGPLPLANLASVCPELDSGEAVALLDLGAESSDWLVLANGVPAHARTLSVGVAGLPATADSLLASLRQSLLAWTSVSETAVAKVYIMGAGMASEGMSDYLEAHLGVEVAVLPQLQLGKGDQEFGNELVGRYAKSIGLALGLKAGARDLDLRQGELSYQRGYGFIAEKVPVLAGLLAVMLVSFVFSAWAEGRSLEAQNDVLADALANLSRDVLGEDTSDVDRVLDLIESGARKEVDPQPQLDGFDIAVTLARVIPTKIDHTIQELELRRGHVKLRGTVPEAEDAQKIEELLKKEPCFKELKISQISKVVKSERQKYSMEFEVRCKEKAKKKAIGSKGQK